MQNLKIDDWLIPPNTANKLWFQDRGRALEQILCQMLLNEGMEPEINIRPKGEEIDGSFFLDSRVFLIEAKWHSKPIVASHIYAFRGKVDGKLIGTIGFFFSMSDYSSQAIDAVMRGKEINIILFSSDDIHLIDQKMISMRKALLAKLRFATEYGQPFYSLRTHLAKVNLKNKGIDATLAMNFIIESEQDARTLECLLSRFHMHKQYTIIPSGSEKATFALSHNLIKSSHDNVTVILQGVVDDKLKRKTNKLKALGVHIINLPQSLENWLENHLTVDEINSLFFASSHNGKMARRFARRADLKKLLSDNPDLNEIISEMSRK